MLMRNVRILRVAVMGCARMTHAIVLTGGKGPSANSAEAKSGKTIPLSIYLKVGHGYLLFLCFRLASSSGVIHDGLGNYSVGVKCSWLIDAPNSSITLHLEEFATECGWDHLYVYDGDSVDSPLLAVFRYVAMLLIIIVYTYTDNINESKQPFICFYISH